MSKIGFKVEHPGIVLWEEYLKPRGITQTRFARDLNISFARANEVLNGKRGFTPDTALRVAKYLGTTAEYWINWQATYDLQRTEKKHRDEYKKIPVAV
ncbi:MAG: transcriptional regulator [bacterium]|nr:MAG: transcriptional regulator [bacterium]